MNNLTMRHLLTGCVAVLIGTPLFAQTEAPTVRQSTEQMIEQLRSQRTRSIRNLSVEAVSALPSDQPSGATSVPPPSLSLLIQFDFNSARIRPESQQTLLNLSQALQSAALKDSRFAVEGHTDARGGAQYNQKLSQQRAVAVGGVLTARGVDPSRLQLLGKGDTELVNKEQPLAPENRRVRIINLD